MISDLAPNVKLDRLKFTRLSDFGYVPIVILSMLGHMYGIVKIARYIIINIFCFITMMFDVDTEPVTRPLIGKKLNMERMILFLGKADEETNTVMIDMKDIRSIVGFDSSLVLNSRCEVISYRIDHRIYEHPSSETNDSQYLRWALFHYNNIVLHAGSHFVATYIGNKARELDKTNPVRFFVENLIHSLESIDNDKIGYQSASLDNYSIISTFKPNLGNQYQIMNRGFIDKNPYFAEFIKERKSMTQQAESIKNILDVVNIQTLADNVIRTDTAIHTLVDNFVNLNKTSIDHKTLKWIDPTYKILSETGIIHSKDESNKLEKLRNLLILGTQIAIMHHHSHNDFLTGEIELSPRAGTVGKIVASLILSLVRTQQFFYPDPTTIRRSQIYFSGNFKKILAGDLKNLLQIIKYTFVHY